jgi:hypothetical protein
MYITYMCAFSARRHFSDVLWTVHKDEWREKRNCKRYRPNLRDLQLASCPNRLRSNLIRPKQTKARGPSKHPTYVTSDNFWPSPPAVTAAWPPVIINFPAEVLVCVPHSSSFPTVSSERKSMTMSEKKPLIKNQSDDEIEHLRRLKAYQP